MKKYLILPLIIIALFQSCNSGTTMSEQENIDSTKQVNKVKNPPSEKPKKTNEFATKAAIGGIMEVESGAQMIKNTENPDVQNLATIMLKDHLMINSELASIAKKLSIYIPSQLPTEKKVQLVKMEPLEEEQRNLFYARLIFKEHQQAVSLFQTAANSETGELQKFAAKHLPLLKEHLSHSRWVLDMVEDIQKDKGDLPLKITKPES